MSTTIIGSKFKVEGDLAGFDEGSDSIRFTFKGGYELEVHRPTKQMIMTLSSIGLNRLAYAEINFMTTKVILGTPAKHTPIQGAVGTSPIKNGPING